MEETLKTAKKTVRGRPFTGADDPRSGHGLPGRSGRRPSEIAVRCRDIIEQHKLLDEVRRIALDGKREGDRLAATKLLLSYGHGLPVQPVEHTGEDGGPIEYLDTAKAEFQGRMDRLASRLGAAAMPEWPESA